MIYILVNVFHLIITLFKNYSDMCEIKTILLVAALLLAATGFCINQVNSEKKVGHHSEIKCGSYCEKKYKNICLNGDEC